MGKKAFTRRNFIEKAAIGIAGASVSINAASSMSAASYKKIIGANDRIHIGFLGCGGRSEGH